MMTSGNTLQIGQGIYTIREMAQILGQPYHRVYRWVNIYWDERLGESYGELYSWRVEGSQAVGFHTLVEFYLLILFGEAGVAPRKVLEAHRELYKLKGTPFPFANREVLKSLRTDGTHIYFELPDGEIMTLDGTRQLNMEFVELFFKKLSFDTEGMASSFWPLGKEKAIVVDPARKFGHPLIAGHNIYPETLLDHFKAGDPIPYIAHVYQLSEQQVADALEFCQAA